MSTGESGAQELKHGEIAPFAPRMGPDTPQSMTADLAIEMPQGLETQTLALSTGAFTAHYKLYIQNVLAYDSREASGNWGGDPGYTSIGTVALPAVGPDRTLRLKFVFDTAARTTLEMDTPPRIGSAGAIVTARAQISIAMLILFGAMAFAAAYHVVIYAATRDSPTTLMFAAFCALFGLRTLMIEPIAIYVVPYIGPEWLWRLNYALTALLGPACYWFFAFAFPGRISRILGSALTVFCVASAAACLVVDYPAANVLLKLFQLSALVLIVAIFRGIVAAVWAKETGSVLALAGWVFSALPAIHDILANAKLINGPNLMPFGFMAFFLCLAGILSARLHRAHEQHKATALELQVLNASLETRIAERTDQLLQQLAALERQQHELEAARAAAVAGSQAKSRFLANMSHELRTPLNAIIGFSEMIENRIFGETAGPKYAEYAGFIRRSGGLLLRLINGVLDLSKIEAGKFELNIAITRLTNELAAACELVALQAAKKGIAMSTEGDGGIELNVDRIAFQQVLLNLLSNAIKFTPSGGKVRIQTTRCAAGGIRIAVEDTGAGIAEEDLNRVMESFGQARHDVTTYEERGTGLGLPIARGLVEAHGGTLTIDSVLGQGTTVTIALPASCLVAPRLLKATA